jgi:hypothetical protein
LLAPAPWYNGLPFLGTLRKDLWLLARHGVEGGGGVIGLLLLADDGRGGRRLFYRLR